MSWIAPEVELLREPVLGPERAMLDGFLEAHRAGFLRRCAGLTGDRLAEQSVPPSDLSLLGLIRHLSDTERTWFRIRLAGQSTPADHPDPFTDPDPASAERDHATLLAEWELCRQAVAGLPLDRTFQHYRYGELSLRWLYLHLIREYAGHLGHADLLRERIDGRTYDD
jgi:hypothetical protein